MLKTNCSFASVLRRTFVSWIIDIDVLSSSLFKVQNIACNHGTEDPGRFLHLIEEPASPRIKFMHIHMEKKMFFFVG